MAPSFVHYGPADGANMGRTPRAEAGILSYAVGCGVEIHTEVGCHLPRVYTEWSVQTLGDLELV